MAVLLYHDSLSCVFHVWWRIWKTIQINKILVSVSILGSNDYKNVINVAHAVAFL